MLVCSVACSIALKQGDGKWRLENDGANSMAGKTTGLGVRFWPGLSFSQPSWLVHHFPVLHFPLSVYVKHHVHSFVQKYSVSLIQLSASCRSQLCSQCYAAVYECFEGLPDISVLWGFTLCILSNSATSASIHGTRLKVALGNWTVICSSCACHWWGLLISMSLLLSCSNN